MRYEVEVSDPHTDTVLSSELFHDLDAAKAKGREVAKQYDNAPRGYEVDVVVVENYGQGRYDVLERM